MKRTSALRISLKLVCKTTRCKQSAYVSHLPHLLLLLTLPSEHFLPAACAGGVLTLEALATIGWTALNDLYTPLQPYYAIAGEPEAQILGK